MSILPLAAILRESLWLRDRRNTNTYRIDHYSDLDRVKARRKVL
jgi:hypothetical protein